MQLNLLQFSSFVIIHYFDGNIPRLANFYPTVHPNVSATNLSCSHSFGGTIPFSANNIATVLPFKLLYIGS